MTKTAPLAGIDLFDAHRLLLSEIPVPVPSPEHAEARDRVWDAAVRANPSLFDGPVVACAGVEWAEPHVLHLRWAPVTYRHYALRRVPGGRALGSLFVNVIQPTVDGRVVVARMSPSTAAPGRWQLPGGSVEPPKDSAPLDETALAAQAARELSEELGIDVAPDRLRLFAVTRGENTSVGVTYQSPTLPEAEVREAFAAVTAVERARGVEPELDELALVRAPRELAGLVGPHADYLEPLVARCAQPPAGLGG
ncbi:NUDIX hydrolase [Streptomyces sp. KLOTTS4A1]|uniref:NUDIX hydrolase n=1 Tax=Streptomyces sp. KLOTTS4A1 TaxID=3390996 RepID=UPI0039F4B246